MRRVRSRGGASGGQKNFLDFGHVERREASDVDAVLDSGHAKWRQVVIGEPGEVAGNLEDVNVAECEPQQGSRLPKPFMPAELSQA
ncbi:hypothetical protein D3C71_1465820 [compost metagenome]